MPSGFSPLGLVISFISLEKSGLPLLIYFGAMLAISTSLTSILGYFVEAAAGLFVIKECLGALIGGCC